MNFQQVQSLLIQRLCSQWESSTNQYPRVKGYLRAEGILRDSNGQYVKEQIFVFNRTPVILFTPAKPVGNQANCKIVLASKGWVDEHQLLEGIDHHRSDGWIVLHLS